MHADIRWRRLLFYHLRDRGIYIQDGFPLFLTTAHSARRHRRNRGGVRDSLNEMAGAGVLARATRGSAAARSTAARSRIAIGVPPTESQTEIWLSAQMGDEASCAFNESVTLRLKGALDQRRSAAALAQVVARHDALRARFSATGEAMSIPRGCVARCLPCTRCFAGAWPPDEDARRLFASRTRDAVRPGRRSADPRALFKLSPRPSTRWC